VKRSNKGINSDFTDTEGTCSCGHLLLEFSLDDRNSCCKIVSKVFVESTVVAHLATRESLEPIEGLDCRFDNI
jgi:hypothetical protein